MKICTKIKSSMKDQVSVGQVGQNQGVAPTVMVVAPQTRNQSRWLQFLVSKKAQIILGSIQFFLGILSIAFNIAAIAVKADLSPASHGIWGGIIVIMAGIFGILAAKRNTRCWNVTSLVFSVIAAELCIPILMLSTFGIKMDKSDRSQDYNNYGYYERHRTGVKYEARFAMNGMIIAIAVTEGIVGVFASILACRTLCSGGACQGTSDPEPQQVQIVGTGNSTQPRNQTFQPTQVLVLPALTGSLTTGFTAPGLMTTGGPPAYSTPATQNDPPPEPEKSASELESVSVSLNKPLME